MNDGAYRAFFEPDEDKKKEKFEQGKCIIFIIRSNLKSCLELRVCLYQRIQTMIIIITIIVILTAK